MHLAETLLMGKNCRYGPIISLYNKCLSLYSKRLSLYSKRHFLYSGRRSLYSKRFSLYSERHFLYSKRRSLYSGRRSLYSKQLSLYSKRRPLYSEKAVFIKKRPNSLIFTLPGHLHPHFRPHPTAKSCLQFLPGCFVPWLLNTCLFNQPPRHEDIKF
jgi:hypothetical protein